MLLTVGLATVLAFIYAVDALINKKLVLTWRAGYIPVGLMALSYILSTFLQSPNFAEALFSRTILVLGLCIIYFVASNFLDRKHVAWLTGALLGSISLLALLKIAHSVGATQPIPLIGQANLLWNPTSSAISLVLMLGVGLAISLTRGFKSLNLIPKVAYFALSVVIGISLALSVSEIVMDDNTKVLNLPYATGYSIAIDILKYGRTAMLGIGPDNYLAAFTFYKPAQYNANPDLWNVRFTTSSNEPFQVFTTNGLIGIAALLLVYLYLTKSSISQIRKGNYGLGVGTLVLLVGLLFFPANTTLLILLFYFMLVHSVYTEVKRTWEIENIFIKVGISGVLVALVLAGAWLTGKYALADYYFQKSVVAFSNNDGIGTYDNQVKAIQINPRRIGYRVAFSNTNLLLAANLAQQEKLTEEQQKTLVDLIKQSVNHANAAVALNVQNVNSWEHRARTYRQLINLANGAADFAFVSYNNALRLDPRNPRLMVDYGGFLSAVGQNETALTVLRQAVQLKPDYANAHYNLANVLIAEKRYVDAYRTLQVVANLVDPASEDYKAVTSQLTELQKLAEQQVKDAQQSQPTLQGDSDLSVPSPAPERPENVAPVDLPEAKNLNPEGNNLLPLNEKNQEAQPTPVEEQNPTQQPGEPAN